MFEPNPAILGTHPGESIPAPPASVRQSRRRAKPQLSCIPCRQKKLKCDRIRPCQNCVKRGQPESCDYVERDSSTSKLRGAANVQDRVRQLEDMVTALLNSQASLTQNAPAADKSPTFSGPPTPLKNDGFAQSTVSSPYSQIDTPKNTAGKFTTATDQVNFVGSEHWEAILEEIKELRVDLAPPERSETNDFKPQILFGVNDASIAEIMASIPPKHVCDVLISRWFRTMDLAPMLVHIPTFMKEYNEMFSDPNEMPLTWIALFFSILGLASYFFAISGEELHNKPEQFTSMWEMSRHFRDRTAQCLVEVNYLNPKRHTVEALCFYYALEKFQARESEFGAYVVLGIIVRVAMRLGYNRDASNYQNISQFDGEMRRRVWLMIFQLDVSASTRVGLPRIIREEETDTAEPKNLLDTDFDANMTELPSPRPSTEITPVAFTIFLVRMLRQFGRIVDKMNSLVPPFYDEVMRLDSKLMETHATLPPQLAMRSLSLSITDDADLILKRFTLEVCLQKSRCVLHRKYLVLGKSDPQFQYSRAASVDAAMKLLDVQYTFYNATQPGGQLFGEQWRTTGLINEDYVLAAMILCLYLSWGIKAGADLTPGFRDEAEVMCPRDKILQVLKGSHDVWCQLSVRSALAEKASETLRLMLRNLESAEDVFPSAVSADLAKTTVIQSGPADSEDLDNIHLNSQYGMHWSSTDFLMSLTDTEMNFDWESWDNQFKEVPVSAEDFGPLVYQ